MTRILLVEDEPVILKALKRLLERNHYEVHCATTAAEALAMQPRSFDLILADLRLPGDPGTVLIEAADPIPVVIMTSHASVRSAVDAMRHGANDYIAKPFDHDELLLVIERSLQQNLMHSQNRALRINMERLHSVQQHIQGTELENLLQLIFQRNPSCRCLHLFGEIGTDKEILARAVHDEGPHKNGPLLVLDVSTDTEEAARLLLGVAEQAQADSAEQALKQAGLPSGGYLQAAQNGTLVIRYPELLGEDVQLALCKSIAGSALGNPENTRQRCVNVALVGISHASIETLVKQGQLTNDFANLFIAQQYEVSPLRRRPHDIIKLATRHLDRISKNHSHKRLTLSQEASALLVASDWPGNVSELESVLDLAFLRCRTRAITLSDLGINLQVSDNPEPSRDLSLDEYFKYFVIRNQSALSETELAARLGISRKALWERRQKMDLPR